MATHVPLEEALAPLADVLDRLAAAGEDVLLKVIPLDDSPGMAELAAEELHLTPEWTTPFTNTTSYASILGHAAVDATKAFAHHLRHPDLLVWAPYVNARAGLDAAGYAFWLSEPAIGVEARITRGLAVRLDNARQMRRAPNDIPAARDNAKAATGAVKSIAAANGWHVVGKNQRPRVGGQQLPTPRDAITAVLAHRQGSDFDRAADVEWWFYSGITHAAPYALAQFLDAEEAQETGVPGVGQAPVFTSGEQLVSAAASLGRAVLNLADAHGTLLGLDLQRVHQLDGEFADTVVGLLNELERSQPPT